MIRLFITKKKIFRKMGILSGVFLFGTTCILNGLVSANASSQSVLGIAKGGTNANTVKSAQKNLGLIDIVSSDSTDSNFPSSKAVYNFINYCIQNNGCTPYFLLAGSRGKISKCSTNKDCSISSSWTTAVQISGQSGDWMETAVSSSQFIVAGANGLISKCEKSSGCSTSSNWTPSSSISNAPSIWYGATYGNEQFIVVGTQNKISRCLDTVDCSQGSNWSAPITPPNSVANGYFYGVKHISNGNSGTFIATGNPGTISSCLDTLNCSLASNWTPVIQAPGLESSYLHKSSKVNNSIFSVGGAGKIAHCLLSTDCSIASNWLGVSISGQSSYWIEIVTNNTTALASGNGGLISTCSIATGCSQSSNWSSAVQAQGMGEIRGSTTFKNQFLVSGASGLISICKGNNGCSKTTDWTQAVQTPGQTYMWYNIVHT
ncbi:MAG: hypothetical protein LBT91_03365 [Bifidobacteriaceae bacterium]|jgi:hypothetical protein|nr:hypothetical protein [Bifidobacteriaceae bacterium]